jgi:hypothetical protein
LLVLKQQARQLGARGDTELPTDVASELSLNGESAAGNLRRAISPRNDQGSDRQSRTEDTARSR